MADLLLLELLLFFSWSCSIAAQPGDSIITLGSSFFTNSKPNFWQSSSGRFAFGFYPEYTGFRLGIWIAGIPNRAVVWTAWRGDSLLSDGANVLFTSDGRIILRSTDGQETPISFANVPGSYASMLDSGNLVLCNSLNQSIWETFYTKTDTIIPGQRLSTAEQLYSNANETDHNFGRFRLSLQFDGNLVLYPTEPPYVTAHNTDYYYWATNTSDQGVGISLNLDLDGRLYLLDPSGISILNLTQGSLSSDGTIVYRATLDVDGIFRIYSHSFGIDSTSNTSVVWSSISDGCLVKGICGFNAYCSLVDKKPICLCPTGFSFVNHRNEMNPGNEFQDCEKNFIKEDCEGNIVFPDYSILELENTVWEDKQYGVLSSVDKQGCQQACLLDCNCEAAIYKEGWCSKQKLPLIYGRSSANESAMAFIKVGNVTDQGPPSSAPSKKSHTMWFLLVILLGFLIVLVILAAFFVFQRIQMIISMLMNEINLRPFTFRELKKATGGFSMQLGEGAFGPVFKGTLPGGIQIAVKRLAIVLEMGEEQFQAEMNVIGRIHHKNLIRLLGYCKEGSHRLLVYEFMSNGDLAKLLFQERRLEWQERVRISIEIARGLTYLHEECVAPIIHCDIKAPNVLLDESLVPKISDFGISKMLGHNQTRTLTTRIRGTRGYMAPEWYWDGPITDISAAVDVYSFGVMLLEIICCRRNPPVDEIRECFVDGRLEELGARGLVEMDIERRGLEKMVMVALLCIQQNPSVRPAMKNVALMLEGTIAVQLPTDLNPRVSDRVNGE